MLHISVAESTTLFPTCDSEQFLIDQTCILRHVAKGRGKKKASETIRVLDPERITRLPETSLSAKFPYGSGAQNLGEVQFALHEPGEQVVFHHARLRAQPNHLVVDACGAAYADDGHTQLYQVGSYLPAMQ